MCFGDLGKCGLLNTGVLKDLSVYKQKAGHVTGTQMGNHVDSMVVVLPPTDSRVDQRFRKEILPAISNFQASWSIPFCKYAFAFNRFCKSSTANRLALDWNCVSSRVMYSLPQSISVISLVKSADAFLTSTRTAPCFSDGNRKRWVRRLSQITRFNTF